MFLVSLVIFSTLLSVNTYEEENTNAGVMDEKGGGVDDVMKRRSREHVEEVLRLRETGEDWSYAREKQNIHSELLRIYNNQISPMESLYNYPDLGWSSLTESDLKAKPLVLFVGPWSAGKTSMINYLLNNENTSHSLHTGAEPTTTEFTVLSYSDQYKTQSGEVVASDLQFNNLERLGSPFIERLKGISLPKKLLQRVTLVDTPGSIENRMQQDRGYSYDEALKWFVDRASLIFLLFDPFRLEVGKELQDTFSVLKGKESKLRIVLNKADAVGGQELMRLYGTLLWNIAPLLRVVEPPRIYIGSFWGREHTERSSKELLLTEEKSLVSDLQQAILNNGENKMSMTRKHAKMVHLHAALIDRFIEVYNQERSMFGDNDLKWKNILDEPDKFDIFTPFTRKPWSLNRSDLPHINLYHAFFKLNKLWRFFPLQSHCRVIWGCPADSINEAVTFSLPKLLASHKKLSSECGSGGC